MEVKTVLCPVDFSPISLRNLRMAVEVCKRVGARLVIHHNLDVRPPGFLSVAWMWSEDKEAGEEEKVAQVPDRFQELFDLIPEGVEYEAKVTRGPLEETLLFVARGLPADLIVMGSHGKSGAEHDSLTEKIIIKAPCSVLTIGEGYVPEAVFDAEDNPPAEQMTMLVPVDFTPQGLGVLGAAIDLANDMPHRVEVLHVVVQTGSGDAAQEEREVEAARQRLQSLIPDSMAGQVSVQVKIGGPAETVLSTAKEVDALAIIMGAHGKGMLKRFLFGTTTMTILHGAECPVWFMPDALTKEIPGVTNG
jgi:universal stress protein A